MAKRSFKSSLRVFIYLKYLIPNLFTCLSIYFAYLAFVTPDVADRCWYLLICVLMDKLDGTSARLLKATSKFGLKFDSIADAVAFGLLPGLIIYESSNLVEAYGHWGLMFKISGLIYIVATFYRLRKFDRMATQENAPDTFFGIPSTLAAAVFCAYCVTFSQYFEEKIVFAFLLPVWGFVLSVLMNGNFPTLKVGKPEKKSLLILQGLGFLYLFIAIPMRATAPVLFILAVVVLFITIYFGRKKYNRDLETLREKEALEEGA